MSIIALTVVAGCNRTLVVKTQVDSDERISNGDTVCVDGLPVGTVQKLTIENNQRFALLAITDADTAKSKMRKGVARIKGDGGILLQTDAVQPDAALLQKGDVIPTHSRASLVVRKYATQQTAIVIAIVVVAAILLVLLLKAFVRSGLLILALILAGAIAWAAQPYAAAAISRAYSLLPQNPAISAANSEVNGDSPSPALKLSNRILTRPDPRVVGYAVVFLFSFIGISIVTGTCVSKLTRHS